MGCHASKDVMSKIKDQEKKIDDLLEINRKLEQRLKDLNINMNQDTKHPNDTNDLTNLKTTIDLRFNKLEKTVEKIHHEFKLKLFDGVVDNLDDMQSPNVQKDASLTLNFEKEKGNDQNKKPTGEPQTGPWNDLLQESNLGPQRADKLGNNEEPIYEEVSSKNKSEKNDVINPYDIKMDINTKNDGYKGTGINFQSSFDNKTKGKKSKQGTMDIKEILQDDQVKKIYSEVKKTMFKKSQN